METYSVKKSNVRKTKQDRLMLLLNCSICSKNSTFLKLRELHNFNDFSND